MTNRKNRTKGMKFRKEPVGPDPDIREVKLILLFVGIIGIMWFAVIPGLSEQAQPLRFILPEAFAEETKIYFPMESQELTQTGTGTACPAISGPSSVTQGGAHTNHYEDSNNADGCTFNAYTVTDASMPHPSWIDSITDFIYRYESTSNSISFGACRAQTIPITDDVRLNLTKAYDRLYNTFFYGVETQTTQCITGGDDTIESTFMGTTFKNDNAVNSTFWQFGHTHSTIPTGIRTPGSDRWFNIGEMYGGLALNINPNNTNNIWQMQEHKNFAVAGSDHFFGIDDTTFTLDTGANPTLGQSIIFKQFNKTDFTEGQLRITGGYQALSSATDQYAYIEIKDGEYAMGNLTNFPSGSPVLEKDGGSLAVIHINPSDTSVTPFDLKLNPNWSNSTSDVVTVFIGAQSNSTGGRIIMNVTSFEIDSEIKYDFDDILDIKYWETNCNTGLNACRANTNHGFTEINTIATSSVSGAVNPTPPSPTGGLAVSTGETTIDLTWDHNLLNATDFVISRNGTKIVETDRLELAFSDSGLTGETNYEYEVCALNGDVAESTCTTMNATTDLPAPPDQVTGLVAVQNGVDITLTWDSATGADSYRIYRTSTETGDTELFVNNLNPPNFPQDFDFVSLINSDQGGGGQGSFSSAWIGNIPVKVSGKIERDGTITGGDLRGCVFTNSLFGQNDITCQSTSVELIDAFSLLTTPTTTTANFRGSELYNTTSVNNGIGFMAQNVTGTGRILSNNGDSNGADGNAVITQSGGGDPEDWSTTSREWATQISVLNQTKLSADPFVSDTSSTSLTYDDSTVTTDAVGGHTYFYRISALNSGGEGGLSNVANATAFPPTPLPPINVLATADLADVLITWEANATDPDDWKVQRQGGLANATLGEWEFSEQDVFGGAADAGEPKYNVMFDDGTIQGNGKTDWENADGFTFPGTNTYGPNPIGPPPFSNDIHGLPRENTGDNLLWGNAQIGDTIGDGYIFKVFNKTDFPTTGTMSVTWAGWVADCHAIVGGAGSENEAIQHPPEACGQTHDSSTRPMLAYIQDGNYSRFNATNWIDTASGSAGAVPQYGAGNLLTVTGGHYGIQTTGTGATQGNPIKTNSSAFDISNSTEDLITVMVRVQDPHVSPGRNYVMELEEVEITGLGTFSFQRETGTDDKGFGGIGTGATVNYTTGVNDNGFTGRDHGFLTIPFVEDNWITIATVGGAERNYTDTTVDLGTDYSYRVLAVEIVDSDPSEVADVFTNQGPQQVFGVNATWQNINDVQIGWEAITYDGDGSPTTGVNLIKYQIFVKNVTASETEFSFLTDVNETTTTFTHETDTFPDELFYTVNACNEIVCGFNSTETEVQNFNPPENATAITATAVNATVLVDWDSAPFALNYTVLRALTEGFNSPDFFDNFTVDNWADSHSARIGVNTVTEVMDVDMVLDSSNDASVYDLQNILGGGNFANATNWALEFNINFTTLVPSLAGDFWVGLDSTDETVNGYIGNADRIGMSWQYHAFEKDIRGFSSDDAFNLGSDGSFDIDIEQFVGEEFCVRIIRDNADDYTVQLFEGAICGNTSLGVLDLDGAISSSIEDLRYIKVSNRDQSGTESVMISEIDNMKYFDGNSGSGLFSVIAEGVIPDEYTDTSVAQATNYTYGVYGVNEVINGTTAFSNDVLTNTLATAPQNLTGAMGIVIPDLEDVFLNWEHPLDNGTGSPSTGVDIIHYQIERKAGVGAFAFLANTSDATPMYEDETVVSAANYTWHVRGVNAFGFSPFSNTFSIITTPLMPPDDPTNLTATTLSGSEIQLDWLAAIAGDPPTDYVLQERHVGFGGFVTIATIPAPTLTYTSMGLVSGDTYDYQLRAENGAGTSGYTAIATNTTFSTPSAPLSLTADTINQTAIFLDWEEPTITNGEIQNYTLDIESPVGGGFTFLSSVNGNVTNFTSGSLTSKTEYNFRVNATNLIGSGPYSIEVANTTFGVPSEPINLNFDTNGISEITVDWDQPTNNFGSAVTGYRIDQAQGIGGTFVTVIANTGNNIEPLEELFNGLLQQTSYVYRIAGFNSFGLGDFSGNLTAGTFIGPSSPENFFAQFNATKPYSVNLSWETPLSDGGKPIQGYLVERKDLSGVFQLIANLTSPLLLNYTDTNLINLAEHEYRVAAYSNPTGSFTPGQPVATVVSPNFQNFVINDFQVVGDVLSQQYSITIDDCFPACTLTQADIIRNGITESNYAVGEPISLDTELNFTSHFIITAPGTQFINTSAIVTNLGTQGANETGVVTTSFEFQVDTIFFNHSRTTDFQELNFELVRHPIPWNAECELLGGEPSFLGEVIELPFGGQIILPQSVLVDPFGLTATLSLQSVGTFATPPTFDVIPNRNAYMSCSENDIQILAFTSFGTGNGTLALTGFTDQLGTFLGVPVPFIFIIILAAIWTGRSASTGIIFLAVAIGSLGVLGYFDPLSGEPTSGDSLGYFWAFIVILTLLGVFLGKRFF